MRFLFVGSHLCTRASFRPPLAKRPLPSASSCVCPKGHTRYSYRGLSPHQFMPMSGVHKGFQRTGGTALVRYALAQAEVRGGFAPAAEPWALCIHKEDSAVIEKRQLVRALKGINSRNPFATLVEKGYSADEIKKSMRAALDPHFQNKDVVDEQFSILVPEVVNLAFVESDPRIRAVYDGVQEIYRGALIADPGSCFEVCAAFERDIMGGLSRVWSQMYLEHDKADLPLDEFRQEAFRNIGDIVEG
jgi:hypothetical protein